MKMTEADKAILRNQRTIMLALLNMSCNAGGTLSGLTQDRLRKRIIELEKSYDWVAPPNEKLAFKGE